MNKFVLSALAMTVAAGTTHANEGPDWSGLDSELNALSTSLNFGDGLGISGYLEAQYDTDDGSGDGAFGINRQRLAASGSSGGFGYYFSVDGESSEQNDAYVTFSKGDFDWTMGSFRRPTTSTHLEMEGDAHFMDRSALGGDGAGGRTTGIMAQGSVDAFGYSLHFGANEDVTARVTYDVMSGDGINLSVAYSAGENDGFGDWAEIHLSNGGLSISAISGEDDMGGGDDASVYLASFQVTDTMSVGLRQTDRDDGTDATTDAAITCDCGGARWTFQQNDDDDLVVGCIVGF